MENRFDGENQVPHTEHASGDAAQGVEGTGWGDAGNRHQKSHDGLGKHAGRGETRTKFWSSHPLGQGPDLSSIDTWGLLILCFEGCPEHAGWISSILGSTH